MKRLQNNISKVVRGLCIFGLVTILFFGCKEQFSLDEDPSVPLLAEVPYTTMEELELGVNGIYGELRQATWMTTFYVNGWSGDDITTHRASNKADFREYDQRAISGENSRTAGSWRGAYRTIRQANSVLANIEGVEFADTDQQNRLVGEAHFLRAIMFHHLARIHGRIPLPLSPIPDAELTLASQVEVYEQIESDLLMAESLLPDLYPGVNNGAARPNSGSARALLARLYLDWAGFPVSDNAKYGMAASSAKQVIDNASSHGFGLVADPEDVWTIANRFNEEGVFTVAFCRPCGLANRKFGKLSLPTDYGGWQETFAEIRFFEDFPEQPRKDATYHSFLAIDDNGNPTGDASAAVDTVGWNEFRDQLNPLFKKVTGHISDNLWIEFQTDRNDFWMRYAEVLLIYAEASGRSGSVTADAWEALNMVRRRAENLPVDTPDPSVDITSGDIAELTFTEKKWELAGEYLRWYDLVRMQRVEEALSERDPQVSTGTIFNADGTTTEFDIREPSNPILGSLGTDNYFVPIPPREIEFYQSLSGN
ncbi:MAG: RagB/SusD family nutrient uptake outer membrane protein [Bacteroidota bacterium]